MSQSKRKRFLDPAVLDAAVLEVAEVAQRAGVHLALVGGYAMQLYGSPRLTGDLDFAADSAPAKYHGMPTLSFGGIRTRTSTDVPVDIITREDDFASLYEEAVQTAQVIEGVPVPVVLPEYLAAMKMVAGRSGKDDADLEYLIRSGVVDLEKARGVIKRFLGAYAKKEFDATVALVDWKRTKLGDDDQD